MATVNYFRYRSQGAKLLGNVLDYVRREDKTMTADGQKLVSGIGCSPDFAFQEFQMRRVLHRKESPKWFYHYTQSFHPEEPITGQQAHELAREYAARAWPGCQVLVATHIDARHVHSHFVVSTVREDGKMLRIDPKTLTRLRQLSDELCQHYGYSTLPQDRPKHNQGVSLREERSALKGQSWKFQLMVAIEDCMKLARSKRDFLRLMKRRGYQVRWEENRKSITYITPKGMKCRDFKLHENKFLEEMMELEFRIREEIFGGAEDPEQEIGGASRGGPAGRGAPANDGMAGSDRRTAGGTEPDAGLEVLSGGNPLRAGEDRLDLGDAFPTTGWEKEREALLELALEPDFTQPNVASADPAGDRLMGDLFELGYAVAESQPDVPVKDSTTLRHRREKQKKVLGQKNQEWEERYEQTM